MNIDEIIGTYSCAKIATIEKRDDNTIEVVSDFGCEFSRVAFLMYDMVYSLRRDASWRGKCFMNFNDVIISMEV